MKNQVDINWQYKNKSQFFINNNINEKFIFELIDHIMVLLQLEKRIISILFCDNVIIQELNAQYRKKEYATDVLSFESGEESFLGDIAISIDKVIEQAKDIGHSEMDELLRLLTHGILHLLGYDHERSKEDEIIMFDIENKITVEVKNTLYAKLF